MEQVNIEIELSLHDILEQVHRYNYYVGSSRRDAGHPIKLAATLQTSTDDKQQIETHAAAAIEEIVQIINRYFPNCRHTAEEDESHEGYNVIRLSFRPPHNFPKEAERDLREQFERYTVMRTVQLWMQQVKPDESAIAANESEKAALQIHQTMTSRTRPVNKRKRPDTRIEI